MASPTCTVDNSSTVDGVDVEGSSTVTIELADLAGVKQWSLECISVDAPPDSRTSYGTSIINAQLAVDHTTKTAVLVTLPDDGLGYAWRFRSVVNNGRDVNNRADDTLSTTFAIYVLHSNGRRVIAADESTEGSAEYGWTAPLNACIRNALSDATAELLAEATPNKTPDTLVLRDGTGSASFQSITAGGNLGDGLSLSAMEEDQSIAIEAYDNVVIQAPLLFMLDRDGITAMSYVLDAAGSLQRFGSLVEDCQLSQATRSGTGTNSGAGLTVRAQAGQQQTGGAANNNGGDLYLSSGAKGTGGAGAAGVAGLLRLQVGGTDQIVCEGNGTISIGVSDASEIALTSLGDINMISNDTISMVTDVASLSVTTSDVQMVGESVTANGYPVRTGYNKIKTSDQTVSSTTLANDSTLTFAIGANEEWCFEFVLTINLDGAGGFKFKIVAPASSTASQVLYGYADGFGSVSTALNTSTADAAISTANADTYLRIVGSIVNGANAGSITLQFAENTSGGGATVKAASFVKASRSVS